MQHLVIVDRLANWPLDIQGVKVVLSRDYLGAPEFSSLRRVRLFNLCRSYRYQSAGYYVSLLAEARGHKPMPDVATLLDMKSQVVVRFISEELDLLIQRSLAPLKSTRFELSVYFGRNLAKRYDSLASQLFSHLHVPFLRAGFVFQKKWLLQSVNPIAASDIPDSHRPFVMEAANNYFRKRPSLSPKRRQAGYDLAILFNAEEKLPPSGIKAIKKFIKAASALGLGAEIIGKEDYGRLAEFDALFIRETTNVTHHTFRMAKRAATKGLVVMDDPDSILKCTNKVFLAELLQRHKIPIPRTMIVHRDNQDSVEATLGLPCILKQPDSSFSQGVVKARTPEELSDSLRRLLNDSELVIAQQFMPTDFDWRIGVLDRKAIFVCRYYMAKGHWQIISYDRSGRVREGRGDGVPLDQVPDKVLRVAVKAAGLIGDSLYGVDLKQIGNRVYVIEINDNPNIDSGMEDMVAGDQLYRDIMATFLRRIESRKALTP